MRFDNVDSLNDIVVRGRLPNWISSYLTSKQVISIEDAVASAEKRTSGEIVPVIVSSCVKMKPQGLKLSALFILMFCLYVETRLSFFIDTQEMITLGLGFIVAACLGPLLLRSPKIRRLMMPDRDAVQLAALRAEVEFYRAEIGGTKGGTGIVLFLAIEERQAVVLADKGLSSLLPKETWDGVLALMLKGLKSGACADGLIEAVTKCGDILATHFPIQKEDLDELPNRLRMIE